MGRTEIEGMVSSVYNPTAASTTSSTSSSSSTASGGKLNLKAQDFIKMMITQLQQQDPTDPAKNSDMLAQMSQISQLQSSTDLTTSLASMAQQNQIGSAATMIGKKVTGMDANNNTINGQVTSINVTSDGANLELDNGQTLAMSRVTAIKNGTTATSTTVK